MLDACAFIKTVHTVVVSSVCHTGHTKYRKVAQGRYIVGTR